MSQLLEDIKAVRKLLEKPHRWTKHTMARDQFRNPISASNEDASCWCVAGAARKVIGDLGVRFGDVCEAIRPPEAPSLPWWNDHPTTTYTKVLARIDEVIAAKEAELA